MTLLRLFLLLGIWSGLVSSALGDVVLNRGTSGEPRTLDPAKFSLNVEYQIINDLFLGLVQDSPSGALLPGAAESWTTSADGLKLTFRIRDGLTWSDGVSLNAEDFVYAFRRALDPRTAGDLGQMAYKIKNASDVLVGKRPSTALGVSAPDKRTFVVELTEPSPALIWVLSLPNFLPVPRHVIDKHPSDWTRAGIMVSNGPYVLAAHRQGDRLQLRKNTRYYESSKVRIDEVNYVPIANSAVAANLFRTRGIDVSQGIPPGEEARLRKILPAGSVHITPSYLMILLQPNHDKPPFNNPALWRALSLAIDREVIVNNVLRGGQVASYSIVPPGVPGYEPAVLDFKGWTKAKRLAEARSLMAREGYGPTHPLKFVFDANDGLNGKRLAIACAAMLKQIGMEVEIRTSDDAMMSARIEAGEFALASWGWSAAPDPELFTLYLLSSFAKTNGGYGNRKFDAKLFEAAPTQDASKRAQLFREAEQIGLDDSAVIPLYVNPNRELVAPHLKGWVDNPLDTHPSRWMWIEGK